MGPTSLRPCSELLCQSFLTVEFDSSTVMIVFIHHAYVTAPQKKGDKRRVRKSFELPGDNAEAVTNHCVILFA